MKHAIDAVRLEDVYEALPHNELIGVCQMALGQAVCAADVPIGIAEPTRRQAPMLLRELGRRVAVGEIRLDPATLRANDEGHA